MQATVRWVRIVARVGSIFSIVIIILFLMGEEMNPHSVQPTPSEWIMILFFPLGVIAGMIEGWWHEKAGGLVTVLSLIVFYIIGWVVQGRLPNGPFFVLLSMPGFLFLLAARLDETQTQPQNMLQDH